MELLKLISPFSSNDSQVVRQEGQERPQTESLGLRTAATLNTISTFFQENYRPLLTAFLLYFVALGSITKLKGKELIAASAGSAAWTVVNGASVTGLAATAPIVYGIARMLFNWATTPSSTYERPQAPTHLRRQQEDRRAHQVSFEPVYQEAEIQEDSRSFEQAWKDASQTVRTSQLQPNSKTLLGITHPQQSLDLPSGTNTSSLHVTQYNEDEQVDLNGAWDRAKQQTQGEKLLVRPNFTSGTTVVGSVQLLPQASSLLDRAETLPSPITTSVRKDLKEQAEKLDLEEEEIDLEEDWDSESEISKEKEKVEPFSLEIVENEEIVEDEEIVSSNSEVQKKDESPEKAAFKEKLVEARRIAWEFCTIATKEQRTKMPKEAKFLVGMILNNRERFFNLMEVTLDQRITLLLPSVLTETQKEKIAHLDLKGRYESVNNFQRDFFGFLELTLTQENALMPILQAKL